MRSPWPDRWLTALVAVAAGSCGDGTRSAAPVHCDPVADHGCAAGSHCRALADGTTACLLRVEADAGCDPGSCPAGHSCSVVEGALACRPTCDLAQPACGDAQVCDYPVSVDGAYGVCLAPCDLGTCPDGSTCAPSSRVPYPICVAVGPLAPGARCMEQRCGPGAACLLLGDGARCALLCTPEDPTPCGTGACAGRIEGADPLGFCVD